jgi:hypothetical protein
MNEAESRTMKLEQRHIDALIEAESWIFHSDICPYLELKELLLKNTQKSRERFCVLFKRIYGMDKAGLTDTFLNRFFEILFDGKIYTESGLPDYSAILRRLYKFKRKQNDFALQFSFVSKLVATHQDNCPFYDKHVRAFFGKKMPAKSEGIKKRIEWYVDFLNYVRRSYTEWEKNNRIKPLINRIRARDSRLMKCDTVRLMDYLVWNVGNKKLLKK